MGERKLSNVAIREMDRSDKPIWGRKEKRTGDRRIALNTYVDPYMDRRSGIDRRRK